MTLSPHAPRPAAPTAADPAAELFSDRTLPGWDAALRAAAARVHGRRIDAEPASGSSSRSTRGAAARDADDGSSSQVVPVGHRVGQLAAGAPCSTVSVRASSPCGSSDVTAILRGFARSLTGMVTLSTPFA